MIDSNHNSFNNNSSIKTNGQGNKTVGNVKSRMEESILLLAEAMDLFLSNHFDETEKFVRKQPDFDNNLYLKTALTYTASIFGVISMEKSHLDEARKRIDQLFEQLSQDRKSYSLSSWFFKVDCNDYTDEQANAELIYAECNLLAVINTFVSDPNFLSIIRAALKLRNAHSSYKLCGNILKHKNNWKSEYLRMALDDGYQFGWGLLNLFLSHLPDRVLKILAFVGYSCDHDLGLQMCHFLTETKRTYHGELMGFCISTYSFYVEQFFGLGTADAGWVRRITRERLQKCPEGAFDLLFGARMKQLEGEPSQAVELFKKSINAQNQISALHNVCTWDMIWSYAIQGDWHHASECALYLHDNCSWSKSTNLYQWACFQYMIMEEENKPEMLPSIREAMKKVPELKKRYAGRSIPPEKFAITKALAFMDPNSPSYDNLSLPAFELFYIWNIFTNMSENSQLFNPVLTKIEKKMQQLKDTEDKAENYFVMLFLKGVCLRILGKHQESIDCFVEILNKEKDMKYVTYIPPHAALELGISYMNQKSYEQAKEWLLKARDHYTGFLVETLVHLKIHGALQKIRKMRKMSKANEE